MVKWLQDGSLFLVVKGAGSCTIRNGEEFLRDIGICHGEGFLKSTGLSMPKHPPTNEPVNAQAAPDHCNREQGSLISPLGVQVQDFDESHMTTLLAYCNELKLSPSCLFVAIVEHFCFHQHAQTVSWLRGYAADFHDKD